MEKISGILPATPRTRSVDISSSQAVRAGAPTMGRNTSPISSIAPVVDRLSLSPEFDAFKLEGKMPELPPQNDYKNMEEAKKVKVIDDLNKKFFTSKNDSPTLLEKTNGEVIW